MRRLRTVNSKFFVLAAALLVGACGSADKTPISKPKQASTPKQVIVPVNQKIEDIKLQYTKDMLAYGINTDYSKVSITMGEFEDKSILGQCYADKFGRTIKLTARINAYIFYHEMGHCMFNLEHSDVPGAIMGAFYYPSMSKITKKNLDEYADSIHANGF